MKELVIVTSERKTEIDKPCVGTCITDFEPTPDQQLELYERLKHLEGEVFGGIRQQHLEENSKNFFVYFFLPKSVTNIRIWELKGILADALEKCGIAYKTEVVPNSYIRLLH